MNLEGEVIDRHNGPVALGEIVGMDHRISPIVGCRLVTRSRVPPARGRIHHSTAPFRVSAHRPVRGSATAPPMPGGIGRADDAAAGNTRLRWRYAHRTSPDADQA